MSKYDIKVIVLKRADRRFYTMRYENPITGEPVARSTKTTKRREAERIAAKWEKELRESSYHKSTNIAWGEFRERFEAEKLSGLSQNTAEATATAFNHLERIVNPRRLGSLTPVVLSRFQSELRKMGMKETSIATHLRHTRAALNWAVSMGMLPAAPVISMPKRANGRKLMRGAVFQIKALTTGKPMTAKRVSRIGSAIGKTADVLVNKADGKYASAHDLRRSFGTRWASRLKPATLQLLMRHKSIETTLKYYVDQDADDVADALWNEYGPETKPESE